MAATARTAADKGGSPTAIENGQKEWEPFFLSCFLVLFFFFLSFFKVGRGVEADLPLASPRSSNGVFVEKRREHGILDSIPVL